MTAAVVTLAISIASLVGALLFVLHAYVTEIKEATDVMRQRNALVLDNAGMVAQAADRDAERGRLRAALVDATTALAAFQVAAIVDLPDAAVRDLVNGEPGADGLLAFPGGARRGSSSDTATGEILVRDDAAPDEPG